MTPDDPILHDRLRVAAWTDPRLSRLPGIQPLPPGDWLRVDEVFAAQMALRDRLIAEHPDRVLALSEPARPAAEELLDLILDEVSRLPGYAVRDGVVTRPDGVAVPVLRNRPLETAGRLVQEDLCILENGGQGEHVLTGAVLCFPASWTLAEKFMRPLTAIHTPVPVYDDDLARRVQRLFDVIRPGQGLWRANGFAYARPDLHHPRQEGDPRLPPPSGGAGFVRAERQCLIRLPLTQAVVFSIHTYVVARESLPEADMAALEQR